MVVTIEIVQYLLHLLLTLKYLLQIIGIALVIEKS